MIVFHSAIWSISPDDLHINTNNYLYPFMSKYMEFSFFQMSLPITTGMIFRHMIHKYIFEDQILSLPWKKLFLLFLYFTLLEIFINGAGFNLNVLWDWDILQFTGLSFILLAVLGSFSINIIPQIAVMVLLSTPLIVNYLGSEDYIITGILAGSHDGHYYWPLFPWFSCIAFGFSLMNIYIKSKNKNRLLGIFLTIGISFLLFFEFFYSVDIRFGRYNLWGYNIFQPDQIHFMGLFGFYLTFLSLCFFASKFFKFSKYGIINSYSQGILIIYTVQTILIHRLAVFVHGHANFSLTTKLLIYIPLSILLSWVVGRYSIIYMQEKRFILRLKKAST